MIIDIDRSVAGKVGVTFKCDYCKKQEISVLVNSCRRDVLLAKNRICTLGWHIGIYTNSHMCMACYIGKRIRRL